ncbi:lactonase family protein [Krasilnikovia sp. M28-CT-15]|uniref:lactonase family protein n=1 Tax=Krasilnikovia sp. M28-CT-15 TaxID=3373540 RepID=UPI0038769A3C
MRRRTTLACALALAAGAAVAAGPAQAGPNAGASSGHAVFIQLNSPAGNSVRVFRRSSTGTLTPAGDFPTGGKGGAAANAVVDPLASQGSLVYDARHRRLYAVNAGSDSLAVFDVHGARLTRRQVIASGGAFPVSVAVRGDLLYALNAGGEGAVQGFRITNAGLTPLAYAARSLHLGNTNPPAFLSAPAQVGISPDARHLVVTTKNHNTIDVFALDRDGRPQGAAVVTTTFSPVPFAFVFTRQGIAVTEVATSALTHYRLHPDGTLTPLGSAADGQAALCWIQPLRGHFYGANAGSGSVSAFALSHDGAVSLSGGNGGVAAHPGGAPIDMAASGSYLYVQNPGTGQINGYRANANGTLTPVTTVTGLPVATPGNGMEGIAAS